MTYQFDFGETLKRRKAACDRARVIVAAHVGDPIADPRIGRLAALVAEANERIRAIPAPLIEHPGLLALLASVERDVAAELRRLGDVDEVATASAGAAHTDGGR